MSGSSGHKPELTLAKVLEVFLPEYLQGRAVPTHQLKVLRRLSRCRSAQLGWTVWQCQHCQRSHWRPNGCGDRHCPSCQHPRSRQWLEQQRRSLLPVRYFHWVFTLPARLRPLALHNPKALYPDSESGLFDAASATLLQFGQQSRFGIGTQLGLTAILHTWGQNLMHHPHLHCLVTGGGLTPQQTWAGPKQARWLFPVHAVGQVFRAKFCAGLLQLQTTGQLQFHGALRPLAPPAAFAQLLRQLQAQRWVVFAKGSVVGPDHVLDYLGRYTHRVAISNSRLQGLNPKTRTVAFSYKDYADHDRRKTMTLNGTEFLRRFLLHPDSESGPGFTKIRHYGLLGNNRRTQRVALARAALEQSPLRFQPKTAQPPVAPAPLRCPHCQRSPLRCVARLDASGYWTFFAAAARCPDLPRFLDSS